MARFNELHESSSRWRHRGCLRHASIRVGGEDRKDFVADLSEGGKLLFLGSSSMAGVVKRIVAAVHLTVKVRAILVGIFADTTWPRGSRSISPNWVIKVR